MMIAKIISYLLHPVFMPMLGLLIIMNSGTYISIFDKSILKVMYLVVGTFTIVLPLVLLPVYFYSNLIRSIQISEHRQRIIPYFITFILFYTAHILLKKFPVSPFITSFLFASAMTVLVVLIVTYVWKISSHMAGIGGLTGLVLCLSYALKADMMYYLIAVIILSGILAYSRLKLNAHSNAQVYAGFLLGLLVVSSICLIYSF